MHVNNHSDGVVAEFTITKPMDMHHHPRIGDTLKIVGPMLAKRFAGAIIMPNTIPPVTTADRVGAYKKEIFRETGENFLPLMTMYLTDNLDPEEVRRAIIEHDLAGVKYYPRGLTTNSDSGVKDPSSLWTSGTVPFAVLRLLASRGKVLLLHAADGLDKDGNELDPYEQEPHFLRETLPRIREAHPELKISVEHASTQMAAELALKEANPLLGFSLTPHHLLIDRRDTHRGGLNPHMFWLPPPQAPEHRVALQTLAGSGDPYVWLGSDSAPHPLSDKESGCCKGGVMTVHAGIELYAEAFDKINALDKLEQFASYNGPNFYGVPPSSEKITLRRSPWKVRGMFTCETMPADSRAGIIRPFRLNETIEWKLV